MSLEGADPWALQDFGVSSVERKAPPKDDLILDETVRPFYMWCSSLTRDRVSCGIAV
jgi:hypothetical protein